MPLRRVFVAVIAYFFAQDFDIIFVTAHGIAALGSTSLPNPRLAFKISEGDWLNVSQRFGKTSGWTQASLRHRRSFRKICPVIKWVRTVLDFHLPRKSVEGSLSNTSC